jgi:hypothetical protein
MEDINLHAFSSLSVLLAWRWLWLQEPVGGFPGHQDEMAAGKDDCRQWEGNEIYLFESDQRANRRCEGDEEHKDNACKEKIRAIFCQASEHTTPEPKIDDGQRKANDRCQEPLEASKYRGNEGYGGSQP